MIIYYAWKSLKKKLLNISVIISLCLVSTISFSGHYLSNEYQKKNNILLDSMWHEFDSKLFKNQFQKKKNVIYTGLSLWGNEKWSIGDATNLGLALKNYYSDHNFHEFIFSNDEENKLPILYPSAMPGLINIHFNRIKNKVSKNDLVIIGLFSHGQKGALLLRLGKNSGNEGQANGIFIADNVKNFLNHLKNTNVLLIISACYSGSFIKPLKSSNIAIVTASSADKTSNGCSPLSTGTFYVKNLLNTFDKINNKTEYSIIDVFYETQKTIKKQEKWKDKSLPQVFIGKKFTIDYDN